MKNIELFWNIVYFGIYKFDDNLRYYIGFLNPFNFINKIKGVQKYHASFGINDMDEFRNRVFKNKKSGISIVRSNAIISGILVLFEYGLFNCIQTITKKSLISEVWQNGLYFFTYLIILVVPVVFINNYLLFKNDKYLHYFDKFLRTEKGKRRLYYLLSFTTVLLIISFFIISFLFL